MNTDKNSMYDYKRLGRIIKKYRKANGITQPELAKKLNKSTNTIVRYERGDKIPNEALASIFETLNIPFEILFSIIDGFEFDKFGSIIQQIDKKYNISSEAHDMLELIENSDRFVRLGTLEEDYLEYSLFSFNNKKYRITYEEYLKAIEFAINIAFFSFENMIKEFEEI